MELSLFRTTTIEELKRQFARCFPYLKLEIFSLPNASRQASPMQQRLDDHLLLSQIKTFRNDGALSFEPSMTVAAFRQLLHDRFGLSVLILRKSGDLWIETEQPGNLALEKQNSIGEAASRPMRVNFATLFL